MLSLFGRKKARIVLKILCISGDNNRDVWNFYFPPFTSIAIGRLRGCHVILSDITVSQSHCLIFLQNNKLYITDLASKYGTYLDDTRVSGMVLLPSKSTLVLGQSKFTITVQIPS